MCSHGREPSHDFAKDGKVKGSATVKIPPFTLRKSNLAPQRIFCTFINRII
jgi:hypothetical protein